MKIILAWALALVFLVTAPALHAAAPPGILNHQGRIVVSGANYTGTGFFKFALVDSAGTTTLWSNNGTGTGGGQPTAAVSVSVSQGLYALGLGDTAVANMTAAIPPSVFTGNADVRLRVWFSTDGTTFEQLTPDRRITAAAFALTAGAVADPSFVGTTGNTPLDLSVNNRRALRIQPGTTAGVGVPNLIGGDAGNTISADSVGSVIGGGGGTFTDANSITNAAGRATIAGGKGNVASSNDVAIGCGAFNQATGPAATVAGGNTNTASDSFSTVGGGSNNTASNFTSTVPGGNNNTASGDTSFAAGNHAKAIHDGAFVWADRSTFADFSSTGNNQFLIRATGGVGINKNNPAVALDVNGTMRATAFQGMGAPLLFSTTDNQPLDFTVNNLRAWRIQGGGIGGTLTPNLIGGAAANTISATSVGSTIGGGGSGGANSITGSPANATIAGGQGNVVSGNLAFIGGGVGNTASGIGAMVLGGESNIASGTYSFAGGYYAQAAHPGAFVWADTTANSLFSSTANDQFSVRAAGGVRLFTSGTGLKLDSDSVVFSGNAQLARFGDAVGFDFNTGDTPSSSGLLIEQGINESSGIFFDGDSITMWCPGDNVIAHGNRPSKKLIAQQVEKVFPQAVTQMAGEVPDIYQPASVKDGWVQLATDLKVGERVKLIENTEASIYEVLEVRDGAFRTAFQPQQGESVFVYGRAVKDFRAVDYDAVAMLNVSATQELARKLARAEAENTALKERLARLERAVENLQRPGTAPVATHVALGSSR